MSDATNVINRQPTVLKAPPCILPEHRCGPAVRRGFQYAVPVLITHRGGGGRTALKLNVARPWELTPGAVASVLDAFETYAVLDLLPTEAQAVVDRSVVLVTRVPDELVEMFAADLLKALRFERIG